MRVNQEIRAPNVRVIAHDGEQLGVIPVKDALKLAQDAGLDLVEVVSTSSPPVCKIIDYGKFRYDQTKREKESKKSQHQVKVKEIKLSLNITEHDLDTKLRHAKEFLEKGNKVKISCMFRGREMVHQELGNRLIAKTVSTLEDIAWIETPAKMYGRVLSMVLAPSTKKKKVASPE